MSSVPASPRLTRLRACLVNGLGAAGQEVRTELGLEEAADDRDVAHALVQILSAVDIANVSVVAAYEDPRRAEPDAVVPPPGASFLRRLATEAGHGAEVAGLHDLDTLLAVLRAGTVRQRRAALRRIAEILAHDDLTGGTARRVIETFERLRDVALAYERAHVREGLPGGAGRKARAEAEQWRRDVAALEPAILAFWEGESSVEPLGQLPADARAQLLVRARDFPDLVMRHLCAVIEGSDGVTDRTRRRLLLGSLRYAGDPRLVPTLAGLLDAGELVQEAARALAHVEDPRVRPVLRSHLRRAVIETDRVALAGSLARAGDCRGLPEVRALLARDDSELRVLVLEALEAMGEPEDATAVLPLLDDEEPAVQAAAVRTLGAIADVRALPSLRALASRTDRASLRADSEEAEAAILARLTLLGEDPRIVPVVPRGERVTETPEDAGLGRPTAPFGTRLRAALAYLFGRFLLELGSRRRSVRFFEAAARLRSHWAAPLIAIGMAHARRGDFVRALPAFRRAIETDREGLERNPIVLRSTVRSFLRRAEEIEREGRRDVARGLLGEALSLDLRRAPSALRFEVERLYRVLGQERPS